MRRRHFSSLLVAGAFTGLLILTTACADDGDADRGPVTAPQPETPEADRFGGTMVVASLADLQTMNSLVTTDFGSVQFQRHVLFTTLVRQDADLRPQPYLARAWELSPDSNVVTFHLRTDVTWHDGTPVTARDVMFTFDRLKDPDVGFPNAQYFDYWDAAEVANDSTVVFHLRPHNAYLFGWTQVAILPEHVLGGVAPSLLGNDPFGTVRPVGNGPFRFVERVPGDRWVFEANPDFPEDLGGRPYLDRLIHREIADEVTMLAELRTGGVDMILGATLPMVEQAASDSSITVQAFAAPDYSFIAWNPKRPFFADPAVRRALSTAIDRQAMVETVRGGYATIATGPVGPWHWAYDESWRPLPYAPDSAAARLEEAGWVDVDGDGVRERDGIPFRFELVSSPGHEREQMGQLIQSNLAQVGVDVQLRVLELPALIPLVTSPDRRFDAVIGAWVRDVQLDDRDLWSCEMVGQMFQFTSYCNRSLEPILDSIPLTADRERLQGLIRRYHEKIAADQPYTFLLYQEAVDLYRSDVRGVELDTRGDLQSVARWWIQPEGRR